MINIIYMFQFFFNFGKTNCTGMLPVLIEYHILPVHCHVLLSTTKIIYKKWWNNALERFYRMPVMERFMWILTNIHGGSYLDCLRMFVFTRAFRKLELVRMLTFPCIHRFPLFPFWRQIGRPRTPFFLR